VNERRQQLRTDWREYMRPKLTDAQIGPSSPHAGPAVSDLGSIVACRNGSHTSTLATIHIPPMVMVGRWAALILACACGWLGSVPVRGDTVVAPAEINTFHQFYTLSPELARKGVPVRLKGVVLCYDSGW